MTRPPGWNSIDVAGRRLGQLGREGTDLAQAFHSFFTWLAGACAHDRAVLRREARPGEHGLPAHRDGRAHARRRRRRTCASTRGGHPLLLRRADGSRGGNQPGPWPHS